MYFVLLNYSVNVLILSVVTDIIKAIGRLIAIIVGVFFGFVILAIICAAVPLCICCCLGVGIFAVAAKV